MKGVKWTKVNYTHNRDTLKTPLNIDLNTNEKRQDCKTGTVCEGYQ
jgi:hypothetical protein